MSSITLIVTVSGVATNGLKYGFYDSNDQLIGTEYTKSLPETTFDVSDAAYLKYYCGGSAPASGWRTIALTITIVDVA